MILSATCHQLHRSKYDVYGLTYLERASSGIVQGSRLQHMYEMTVQILQGKWAVLTIFMHRSAMSDLEESAGKGDIQFGPGVRFGPREGLAAEDTWR